MQQGQKAGVPRGAVHTDSAQKAGQNALVVSSFLSQKVRN